MLATLNGKIAEKLGNLVVIDIQGVGYGVLVSAEDYEALLIGNTAKLYIYEHIRENSYDLFGFAKLDTKRLFEQLLDVNGVGPKMALSVLSLGSADDVRKAIAAGEVRFIQGASGVGKRVAERIVVDLKDKVGLIGADLSTTGILQSGIAQNKDEAVEALVSLGFTLQDAATALAEVPKDLSTEERVKKALQRK